jgi:hypothetical protein
MSLIAFDPRNLLATHHFPGLALALQRDEEILEPHLTVATL